MIERALVDAAERLAEPYLVATVVATIGSSYRRPGARMLVTGDRWISGSISGGCLERDVIAKGWWRAAGDPVVVRYATGRDEDVDDEHSVGFRLGCGGTIDVLVERAGIAGRLDPLAIARRCLVEQREAAIATVIGGRLPIGARVAIIGDEVFADAAIGPLHALLVGALRAGQVGEGMIAGTRVVFERLEPPPRVAIVGGGFDALPVANLATSLGWETRTFGRRAELADVEAWIDGGATPVAIVMTHDFERDRNTVAMLLGTKASYIGVLGPRHRLDRIADEIDHPLDERVAGPMGLDLGASTPEAIAVSIVAEISAVLANATGARLRDRRSVLQLVDRDASERAHVGNRVGRRG